MFCFVILLIGLVSEIKSQVSDDGVCPRVTTQNDFDVPRLMGVWYIQAHYPDGFGVAARCNKAEYTMLPNGTVIILNTKVMSNTGQQKSSISTLDPAGRGTDGKFSITFPVGPENPPPPYWVLETDYESYAVAWSCRSLKTTKNFMKHIRYIWLMTRTHNPPANLFRRMSNVVKNLI
ncbi:hypothetical protein WA026_022485 [Henosepilachna vigintioctopunctata]|uniref:Lipocalin/cytosolic fatty-acid binding domain-containing protein n=1 Tax=Henosepilachna vigintioctopunctata TaxID=420089 RepID=A0AAW1U0C2_9CUCU